MYKFPKSFLFGWSQSGFQFEMGIKGSEDPNSDWYVWTRDKENLASGLVGGEFPANGPAYWNNYKLFHENAEEMNLKIARIGIEWSRIFTNSTFEVNVDSETEGNKVIYVELKDETLDKLDNLANKDAVNHYREMLKDLKDRGIEVIINLYHWALPTWLHDPIAVRRGEKTEKNGWLDKRAVIEFAKFAAYVAWKFADITQAYSTMNEPNVYYNNGFVYVKTGFPPHYLSFQYSQIVKNNLIQAHARAYDVIKERDKRNFIGIIYTNNAYTPYTGNEEDKQAVEKVKHDVIWSFLDWLVMGNTDGNEFRDDLKGRLDWIGVNYYTRAVIKAVQDGYRYLPGYGSLCEPNSISLAGRPCCNVGWEVYPEGIYDSLRYYWDRYHLPIYVTENGVSDEGDYLRPYYLVSHIYHVHRAIQDGIDVRGYLHWSLVDDAESRFGLLRVDFPTKRLYWNPSAFIYKEIVTNHGITDKIEHLNKIPPIRQLRK